MKEIEDCPRVIDPLALAFALMSDDTARAIQSLLDSSIKARQANLASDNE